MLTSRTPLSVLLIVVIMFMSVGCSSDISSTNQATYEKSEEEKALEEKSVSFFETGMQKYKAGLYLEAIQSFSNVTEGTSRYAQAVAQKESAQKKYDDYVTFENNKQTYINNAIKIAREECMVDSKISKSQVARQGDEIVVQLEYYDAGDARRQGIRVYLTYPDGGYISAGFSYKWPKVEIWDAETRSWN